MPSRVRVYRIVKLKHVNVAWNGEGASKHGGRWNHPGIRCVYCSSSIALAALELLVHLETADVLTAYRVGWVELDESQVLNLAPSNLPRGWDDEPVTSTSRDIGSDWLKKGQKLALRVPSAVVPSEFNILLNPLHADFAVLARGRFEPFRFDPRLVKARFLT